MWNHHLSGLACAVTESEYCANGGECMQTSFDDGLKKPVKIIFDTDMGGDCDDAGALALIHRLCDKGEAELLAVTHCFNTPYLAGCIDAINHFYGREVPVGVNYAYTEDTDSRGVYAAALCETCRNHYPPESHGTADGAMDSLRLIRTILTEAEDGSVTLVATGTLHTMARLIISGPDDISPMTGREMVARKLRRTVVMGGRFFESWPMVLYESGDPTHHVMTWEYNIRGSGYENAAIVFDHWDGELVLSSYEIGSYIVTMAGYGKRAAAGDPVALAYQLHNGGTGRCSWDHTAVLEAIRPGIYWHLHEFGRISVDREMVTHWRRQVGGRHTYLLPRADYDEIRRVIDDLVDGNG